MISNIVRLQFIFILFFSIISLFSCKSDFSLEKKLLFKLSLGKGEDQIDLVQIPNIPFNKKSRIVMKDGLIYIGNGNSNKVMEFSSFGDILSLYYNSNDNPKPVVLTDVAGDKEKSNRNAYTFDFRNTGEIAVNGKGNLLVEDTVPDNRLEYDETTDSTLSRIVVQFDKEGNFINFLGREGIGGTPFPYIENIEITNKDDIILITRTVKIWIIYWYSAEGSLKYTVKIPLDDLPLPPKGGYIPSLETIVSDLNNTLVYLKINYYNNGNNGLDYAMSYLWTLDLKKANYTNSFRVPEPDNSRSDDISAFLGVNNAGNFFFLNHLKDDTFQMIVIGDSGAVINRSELTMADSQISYRDFYLAPSGLLVALLGKYDTAEVVWWRSDQIPGVQNENSQS